VSTDVSEEHIASIFRVEEISSARNQRTGKWQAEFFVTTAVKTSNPKKKKYTFIDRVSPINERQDQ
jgi:hypothetical protein